MTGMFSFTYFFFQVIFLGHSAPRLVLTLAIFFTSIVFLTFCPLFFPPLFSFMLSLFFRLFLAFILFRFGYLLLLDNKSKSLLGLTFLLSFFLAVFIGRLFCSFSYWNHFRALAMPGSPSVDYTQCSVIKMRAFGYQFY